jgi:outer membrane protein assembly factor BamA
LTRIVPIMFLFLAAAAALAQDEPHFLIERIDVRGAKRVSTDIIVAETRLDANRGYTEQQLREAADRVARLPFLLDAQFSLEKGTVRDAYVLVITVSETKPFFYLVDQVTYYDSDHNFRFDSDLGAVVGMRFFVGRRGMVHFGLDSAQSGPERPYVNNLGGIQVGYTQYDLFGTRAFASFNLRYPTDVESKKFALLPEAILSVPIAPTQTITAKYSMYERTRRIRQAPFDARSAQRLFAVHWTHDVTNDPFFPTKGTRLYAGSVMAWLDNVSYSIIGSDPPVFNPHITHQSVFALEGGVARYWEVSERNSVSVRGDGGWLRADTRPASSASGSRTDFDGDDAYGTLNLGFSRSLWDANRRAVDGDNRIELNLRLSRETAIYGRRYSYESSPSLNAAWVRRNAWGTLRLGVGVSR